MTENNEENHYTIALDGVSGSGKSSTAKRVAERLNILYLDTGAMYRAVTYLCQQANIPFTDIKAVADFTNQLDFNFTDEGNICVNGDDLSYPIRTPKVSAQVSDYCTIPRVREVLVDLQRKIGNTRSSILDGRDIGTVVFPNSKFKYFLWASPEVRAKRRLLELQVKGITAEYDEILKNLEERDQKDSSRAHS
ncbi:MAG: (d)CMP kinase, partial [Fibrobacteria bacterium]|nr:(d)CMP kinase [Fibrobacteria bacterium]